MSGKINGYDSDIIMKALTGYCNDVREGIKSEAKKLAKQSEKELKKNSPRSKKDGDHYADGWTTKDTSKYAGRIDISIYNKKKPGLTHLLEDGFLNARTGRYFHGKKHIAPVQDKLNNDFEKACEEIIENGGKIK